MITIKDEIGNVLEKMILGELPCDEVMFCWGRCDDKVYYKNKWEDYHPLKPSEKLVASSKGCPSCLQKHAKEYRRNV